MALIKNLVKDREEHKVKEGDEDDDQPKKPRTNIKTPTDLQRLKLEKLMKNPEKLIEIPEHKHETDFMKTVPSFVRNVMGSSAGAGSGEFHVYRHLRRKEFARQKLIGAISHRERLDDEYQKKLDENQRKAEERTAKKRAKRQKKKCKKARRQHDGNKQEQKTVEEESESSEEEEEEAEKTDVTDTVQTEEVMVENKETINDDNTKQQEEKQTAEEAEIETKEEHAKSVDAEIPAETVKATELLVENKESTE